MWFRQFTKYVTETDHKEWCHPHSTKHDTQPIAYLISKQVILYQTCGGTCCPGVSTPMIWSLPDSNMTNHITWWNPTVSIIPTLLKPQHRSSPRSKHISTDGRPSLTKTQAKLNITKHATCPGCSSTPEVSSGFPIDSWLCLEALASGTSQWDWVWDGCDTCDFR
jgi:hypothetical protein